MPFPKNPFDIHGGCNCGAIRYRVQVPPFSDRAMTPYKTPGADIGDLRIPAVYVDHCDDCRKATSAAIPMALVCETRTVQASLLPGISQATGPFDVADDDRIWSPASALFNFRNLALKEGFLMVYKSSPDRSRFFCGRCGTTIAYSVDPGAIPEEWGWPAMIDIWLGTVDRKDLEKDYMAPERMLWCNSGIPWIRRLTTSGAGDIPMHPLTKIDKLVESNIKAD